MPDRPELTDDALAAIRERHEEDGVLVGKDPDKTALLAEVDGLRERISKVEARLAEEHRWSRGWRDLAHRKEARVAELEAGIEQVKAARAAYAASDTPGHFREVGVLDAVLEWFEVDPALLDGSTDTDDKAVRALVSEQWSEDWDSPEDASYDTKEADRA